MGVLRNIIKKVIYGIVIFPLKGYLSKEREVIIEGFKIVVPPSVFHPKLYFSTLFLLDFLNKEKLFKETGEGHLSSKVLELGAGSGLLSIFMAKKGAQVTASDINEVACETVRKNAQANNVNIEVVQSDLFSSFPPSLFELIIINPPYYPKRPKNDTERAFFCGESFEYFESLFEQLPDFLEEQGKVIMVLSEDCQIEIIKEIALKHGFIWKNVERKRTKGELNFIFELKVKV
ncbi:methyltransferase [uncultured Arcticibacterium sp.]|uniref:methyltransferase n=1 Tax=uncultured Arcticibacterium sp. TaxID=2173042 RepID=UPI0030FACBB9